ncbi:MAG: choice-of-anchor tandem repeat GloVer-containing protein [Candidatus Sulfotelmatobacter sp.]
MSIQATDAANKAASNNLNRQTILYSLAGAPAKKTLKQGFPWALAFSFLLGLVALSPSAHGQTFSVLYSFASEADGDRPDSLIRDAAGNFYGTTYYGGDESSDGVVFKLDATGKETVLHRFKGADGDGPDGVVRDAAGNLYGATSFGGTGCPGQHGCGTVFKLDANGNETVLHRFGGKGDGTFPTAGVIRDAAGNLYGTTYTGGVLSLCGDGCGTIFKVDVSGKETVLHRFTGGADGLGPYGGLILDGAGNLYGTPQGGGANSYGMVSSWMRPASSQCSIASTEAHGGTVSPLAYGTVFEID